MWNFSGFPKLSKFSEFAKSSQNHSHLNGLISMSSLLSSSDSRQLSPKISPRISLEWARGLEPPVYPPTGSFYRTSSFSLAKESQQVCRSKISTKISAIISSEWASEATRPPSHMLILAGFGQPRRKSCQESQQEDKQQFFQEVVKDICTADVLKHNCGLNIKLVEISTLSFERLWRQLATCWKQQTSGNTLVVSICGSSRSAHFLSDDSDFDLLLIKIRKMKFSKFPKSCKFSKHLILQIF